ncbi:MAG: hypothetical protein ACRENE_17175 [Polyangiaceae bacterium]
MRPGDRLIVSRAELERLVDERLEAKADELAARAVAKILARLSEPADRPPFTTRRGGEVPPEFTGRAKLWASAVAGIPGAVKIGRWWTLPRAAYRAWLDAGGPSAPRASTPATAAPAVLWTPALAYANANEREGRKVAGGER